MKHFLPQLFSCLNSSFVYAVMRNQTGLPYNNPARDIDILIRRSDLKKIKSSVKQIAESNGISVLLSGMDANHWYVVLFSPVDPALQIDFIFNLDFYGFKTLDAEESLKHREFNGSVYHLNDLYAFLAKYLFVRVIGGNLHPRYLAVRDKAVKDYPDDVEKILRRISGGRGGIDFWDNSSPQKIRRVLFFSSMRREPIRFPLRLLGLFYYHKICRLFHRGISISFTGPDGCGKTTVINMLMEYFEVGSPILFHFRPSLLLNLGEVGVKAGIKKEVDRNYSAPHRGKKHGVISSVVRLCYYSLDYFLGYIFKILPLHRQKKIVFFDRYYSDIIVDHERSGIFLGHKFLAWWRHFIPSCQYNFFFRVDPDVILARKQELSREAIERIYGRMEYFASVDKKCFWIDNNGTPEDAVKQIVAIIADRQHKKYAKKF